MSGVDDRPMVDSQASSVVQFQSPPSVHVSFELPNLQNSVSGMGIKKSVTLIGGN